MKISSISFKNLTSFQSKVKAVHRGTLPPELNDKIDVFEETHNNATKLGSGLFATVYRMDDTNYVIKETLPDSYARYRNGNFTQEAEVLRMLPKRFKNTQKLVAQVQTEKDNYYLISTFVPGKAPHYPEKKWTKESLSGFFDTMFQLDKLKIYHNDINQENCLVDSENKARTIDYQFAEDFSNLSDEKREEVLKTPSFMEPSNVQMFEAASLPWYIREMNKSCTKAEIRDFFKTYLESKAKYARKRYKHLNDKDANFQKQEYEDLQAKYFSHPTDDMIDLQAKKLQTLYAFRKTFSIVDPNGKRDKNIVSALPSYICTAACAHNMVIKAQEMKEKTKDSCLKKFLDYEIKYGNFWVKTMLSELSADLYSSGVWGWIERNATLSPEHIYKYVSEYSDDFGHWEGEIDLGVSSGEDLSNEFKLSQDMNFGSIEDVAGMVCREDSKGGLIKPEQKERIDKIHKNAEKLCEGLDEETKIDRQKINDREFNEYIAKRQKYVNSCKKTAKAIKDGNYNATVSNAMMTVYLGSVAKKTLENWVYSNCFDNNKLYKEERFYQTNIAQNIATCSANLLAECAKSNDKEPLLENINNFDE